MRVLEHKDGMVTVRMSERDVLALQVATTEIDERMGRGLANSHLCEETLDLWMKNRVRNGGIHESVFTRLRDEFKQIA